MDGFGPEVRWVESDVLRAGCVELQTFEINGQGCRRAAAQRSQAGGDNHRIEADGIGRESEAEMNAQAYIQRAIRCACDCSHVAAVEADQRQMRLERRQRRRTVGGMKLSGEAEGDPVGGVYGEVGVAARLIAEQRMPGLVRGISGNWTRRKQRIEHTQEGGALCVVGEDGFDVVERVLKPVGLQIATVIE